jgi:hypothetical protein
MESPKKGEETKKEVEAEIKADMAEKYSSKQ